ncbi:sporulation YhaL family protein [Bacillus litorisediminis]|uniref:sporulation YhaL family protein n=1 Tax=Bacillus litorisediminis TaxID=2922713 RepID=UPI001FAFFA29|nr:sporulation YhaL family protein [Bacillus litorisediminis]
MDVPFWVILIVIGIIVSGIMTVKAGKDERKEEEEFIEKEGEIFLERMEKEKERKRQGSVI